MKNDKIVILTGAGVSAESGLATFRDAGGIWSQVRLEDVATPAAFASDPDRVRAFYNMRRANLATVAPNAAHRALGRLTAVADALLITQNVDDLHERGGATNLLHMHGELLATICHDCRKPAPVSGDIRADHTCLACGAAALRPDVVWFGEVPYHMDTIAEALSSATVFAAIGTSGNVYPAAGFAAQARASGAWCVELNVDRTAVSDTFHETLIGPATEVVPAWVDRMLGEPSRQGT